MPSFINKGEDKMPELVQIGLTVPVVQEAVASVTYDKLWMKNFNVMSPSPNEKVRLNSTLIACRDTANGKEVKKPETEFNVRISDLFGMLEDETVSVETRTAVGAAMTQLLTALTMFGKEKAIF